MTLNGVKHNNRKKRLIIATAVQTPIGFLKKKFRSF